MSTTPDIRIVFTASPKWTSQLIRSITGSPVSHVYIEYPSELWGARWAGGATIGGVQKVLTEKARHDVYAEFECLFDVKPGLIAISKYFGEEFDYQRALFLGVASLVKKWFSVKMRAPMQSSTEQFCSELMTRFLQGCALPEVADWNVEQSSPGRLYRFCCRNPVLFRLLETS